MKTNKISNKPKDWIKVFLYSMLFFIPTCYYTNNIDAYFVLTLISLFACVIGYFTFYLLNKLID